MSRILNLLDRKPILFGLFIVSIIFNFLLSHFIPKDWALDLRFAYSVEEAYSTLGNMSLANRDLYRTGIWFLDFPYMIFYSLALVGLLYKIWGNKLLIKLPLLIAFFDLLENMSILQMLRLFPYENDSLAVFASICTSAKWILVAFTVLVLLWGLIQRFLLQKVSTSPQSEYRV
ncbi:hypothetical protein [Algoriphagus sp. CAU 1675]|uniref:hypothetical protein n=1 Tax=Algoriphagus sp. CAU 1675 TaxID=3032597 RepID=UPI0023DCE2F9|nr:hypothetical protein [Algoriphagus sp. CAU 1675]MDF2158527.1 hypothetical protein [Algoriphagus sp. CAU 1675]